MCGIAWVTGEGGEAAVARMAEAIRHRGPDALATRAVGGCNIGHARLSVIDLVAGDQPMRDGTGRFWIVFNGEIYNYRELRAALLDEGIALRTHSDTEVVLEGWKLWGRRVSSQRPSVSRIQVVPRTLAHGTAEPRQTGLRFALSGLDATSGTAGDDSARDGGGLGFSPKRSRAANSVRASSLQIIRAAVDSVLRQTFADFEYPVHQRCMHRRNLSCVITSWTPRLMATVRSHRTVFLSFRAGGRPPLTHAEVVGGLPRGLGCAVTRQ